MVYIFLADGFEEIETIAPVDILRRAGVEVQTVGVTGEYVVSARGIIVKTDVTRADMNESVEMIVLPGGGKGTKNLSESSMVAEAIKYCMRRQVRMAAICAAPSVLGMNDALAGHKATCFPGFEDKLLGAEVCTDPVVCDRGIITGKSAGHSLAFGIALVRELRGEQVADEIARSLYQND